MYDRKSSTDSNTKQGFHKFLFKHNQQQSWKMPSVVFQQQQDVKYSKRRLLSAQQLTHNLH